MGFSRSIDKLKKKYLPKELAPPKELQAFKNDVRDAINPPAIPPPELPAVPPPESVDADAFRNRDRLRRRNRSTSNIRTSAQGAPYSPAPKSLLGS